MINKNSYLYSLAAMGAIVQSAYLTTVTGDVDAYQLINMSWEKDLKVIKDRISNYDARTQRDWNAIARTNEKRISA